MAKLFEKPLLPYGLITVNILGCLLIGFLVGAVQAKALVRPELILFLMVGFLGGFTTFSSFGLETFELMRHSHFLMALWDIIIQVGIGTIAVSVGFWLAFRFF